MAKKRRVQTEINLLDIAQNEIAPQVEAQPVVVDKDVDAQKARKAQEEVARLAEAEMERVNDEKVRDEERKRVMEMYKNAAKGATENEVTKNEDKTEPTEPGVDSNRDKLKKKGWFKQNWLKVTAVGVLGTLGIFGTAKVVDGIRGGKPDKKPAVEAEKNPGKEVNDNFKDVLPSVPEQADPFSGWTLPEKPKSKEQGLDALYEKIKFIGEKIKTLRQEVSEDEEHKVLKMMVELGRNDAEIERNIKSISEARNGVVLEIQKEFERIGPLFSMDDYNKAVNIGERVDSLIIAVRAQKEDLTKKLAEKREKDFMAIPAGGADVKEHLKVKAETSDYKPEQQEAVKETFLANKLKDKIPGSLVLEEPNGNFLVDIGDSEDRVGYRVGAQVMAGIKDIEKKSNALPNYRTRLRINTEAIKEGVEFNKAKKIKKYIRDFAEKIEAENLPSKIKQRIKGR